MSEQKLPPVHPGEILLEEFLKPMGVSQYRLAKDIHVPARRINEIVHGKRAIEPGYGFATGPLLQLVGAILAQSPGPVRP